MEQFAVPSTLASARLIQECGGAAADYAYPALRFWSPGFVWGGLCLLRSGPRGPDERCNGCQEHGPPWATL